MTLTNTFERVLWNFKPVELKERNKLTFKGRFRVNYLCRNICLKNA